MQLPGIIYICSRVVVWNKVAVRLKIALDIPAYELWEKTEEIHYWGCSRVCLVLVPLLPVLLSPSKAPEDGQ